ncbi:MAG: MFS transporter, partial [Rudaea sp.]
AGDLYSVRERARIQGWLSSVWGVAAVVGPTLGGAFAEYASWRWIFLINLPIGAVAIALIAKFLHEQAQHHRHRIDFAGAGLMLIAGSALIFALLQGGQAWPWLSAPSVAIFAVAAILIGATVWIERRAAEPIMPGWLWRQRVLSGTNLAMVCMGAVMMGPNTYLPTFAQSVLGLGAIAAGLVLASMSVGWPFASSLSGRLYLRIGFRDTALGGAVLVVAATVGFLLLPLEDSVWPLVLDQIVLGAGFGLLSTPLLVGVQSTVTWRNRGVATSANIFSRYLGQSLGAAVVGAIFNSAIASELMHAPSGLRTHLPQDINGVIGALHGRQLTGAADHYLRSAIYTATHHVYVGLAAVAVITLAIVLLTPKHFPSADERAESTTAFEK